MVPEGAIMDILEMQSEDLLRRLNHLTEEQASFRYEPEKWSIKEVIGHLTDTERYMGYRLFCIARGEKNNLPGHNEEDFVQEAMFDTYSLHTLLEDYTSVRNATLQLLKNLRNDVWTNWGNANGFPVTVQALPFIIAGHELHHLKILTERYFQNEDFPA
ncbi:DinB family protein [Gracilibacillus suaedae]|uniref:DinB family protein n=1 Tax=Gracilibacillus suaedae TaxID=2820273 RepID=UPI001ABE3703|nr:DinB family protein [Gracilibacillus suaedae]